jgi:hypothetical protein
LGINLFVLPKLHRSAEDSHILIVQIEFGAGLNAPCGEFLGETVLKKYKIRIREICSGNRVCGSLGQIVLPKNRLLCATAQQKIRQQALSYSLILEHKRRLKRSSGTNNVGSFRFVHDQLT